MIATSGALMLRFPPASKQRKSQVTETDGERVSAKDAADYIATLADELAGLAADNGLDVLRYLLEMARDEAKSVARTEPAPFEP